MRNDRDLAILSLQKKLMASEEALAQLRLQASYWADKCEDIQEDCETLRDNGPIEAAVLGISVVAKQTEDSIRHAIGVPRAVPKDTEKT